MSTKTKTDNKDRFVIIMAGGRGERFWPLSREKTPKQLLALLGKKSFLQEAVERVLPLVPLKNIFIITNEVQAPTVRKQLPKLPRENVVAEPTGRDTCAAVTLGAALVGARSTTGVMAVLPADHVIPEEKKFQQVLNDCFDLASRGQAIVTIGIKPTEPATGYGYIQVGEPLPPPHGVKPYKTTFYRAERFVEKPHFDKALEYVN
ncbi:MAG TPA: sugar phosphate nucleotidyltransferase, partial [Candidatus Binatia bacterium]|nr:sugar phosphate nucleotidyltransferase [Candidatus Binatia bacterium]